MKFVACHKHLSRRTTTVLNLHSWKTVLYTTVSLIASTCFPVSQHRPTLHLHMCLWDHINGRMYTQKYCHDCVVWVSWSRAAVKSLCTCGSTQMVQCSAKMDQGAVFHFGWFPLSLIYTRKWFNTKYLISRIRVNNSWSDMLQLNAKWELWYTHQYWILTR